MYKILDKSVLECKYNILNLNECNETLITLNIKYLFKIWKI